MSKFTSILLILGLLLACSTNSAAAELSVHVVFGSNEIAIINDYYSDHDKQHKNKNHKDKGKNSLPPGIAKNLQRGKPLPPGIAKQSLPAGLLVSLPAAPKGYERIIVGGKVLLVEIATQVIHDILEDIIIN
jgi:hypothetical protein